MRTAIKVTLVRIGLIVALLFAFNSAFAVSCELPGSVAAMIYQEVKQDYREHIETHPRMSAMHKQVYLESNAFKIHSRERAVEAILEAKIEYCGKQTNIHVTVKKVNPLP